MRPLLEPGEGLKDVKKDWKCTSYSIFTAITAIVFSISGAIPMMASVAESAGMTSKQAASFVMCSMALGAIASIIISIYYRTPFYFAASLTAVAVLEPMFARFSFAEMIGGFMIAGVVIFLLGYTGVMGWLGKHLPLPIILGMVAGVFMGYGLDIVSAITEDTLSGCIVVGAFVVFPLITKKIPPHIVALVAGVVCAIFIHKMNFDGSGGGIGLTYPVIVLPDFSSNILLTVSLPLVIMALADVFKGYGVLKSNGYDMPLNTVTAISGICSFFAAFGMGHTVSLAGPVMAILAGKDAGEKKSRYTGAVIYCIGVLIICVLTGILIPLIMQLPTTIIKMICGLAMTGLLTSSLQGAFGSGKFHMGALAAFIVGLSKLSLFGIGAPVWAVVFGFIVSLGMEREQFKQSEEL